jgi:acyl-coenzyme A thioesterase PaaI-like protein
VCASTQHKRMAGSSRMALQDDYPDELAHCFGCGRLNAHGHHIRTTVEGDETVSRFLPEPHHTAAPGFVYGGILASLVDCHATAAASAAGRRPSDGHAPPPRYVTALLEVEYLRPTPIGVMLEARGRVVAKKGRRVRVDVRVLADGVECVRGLVTAVPMPEGMHPAR